MRKVLFATTALVALGGVSAASADISVSAANEFQYKSWSDSTTSTVNDTSMTNKQTYKISASAVLDNGMSLSSYISTDGSDNFGDSGFSIAGDFGTIGFDGSEAGDKFATAAEPRNKHRRGAHRRPRAGMLEKMQQSAPFRACNKRKSRRGGRVSRLQVENSRRKHSRRRW